MVKCTYSLQGKHTRACSEDLLHLLYILGLKSPHIPLLSIAILGGKRYFFNGVLFCVPRFKVK